MASIRFLVRTLRDKKPANFYLRLKTTNKDISVSSMLTVLPEYWNNKSQSFKSRIYYTQNFTERDRAELENKITDLRAYVLKILNLTRPDRVSKEWLKDIIEEFHFPEWAKNREKTLNGYIAKYLEDVESGERITEKGERYKHSTIKNMKGFKVQFDEFQKAINRTLDYEDITLDMYDEFLKFFNKKKYSPNTIGRHIKHLKSIMRTAREEGYHINLEIDRKKFKILKVEVDNIYLTEDEVEKLYKLDLSGHPKWGIARDVFLIGCYTAQRFSDYSRISKPNIYTLQNGAKVIKLRQMKTNEQVIIPIRPELENLLKKHNYEAPYIPEQKLNEFIKEVGSKAKINDPIIIEKIEGGIKEKYDKFKHDLIKTHTARRTGCTNMYLAGIPTIDIMKISGHKTEREFLKYIKVSKEETASSLADHPYFSGKN